MTTEYLRKVKVNRIVVFNGDDNSLKEGYLHLFSNDGSIAIIENAETGRVSQVHLGCTEITFIKEETPQIKVLL